MNDKLVKGKSPKNNNNDLAKNNGSDAKEQAQPPKTYAEVSEQRFKK